MRSPVRSWRQAVAGLLALPLSVLPFVAYATYTPEGRLIRDKLMVALFPPKLPVLALGLQKDAADAAPRYRDKVMALVYHGIGSGSDGEGGTVVSPERFGEHLASLEAAGMHAVTAREVARSFTTGRPLPPNAVMITFDDGRTDAMLFADPLLEQAGMKATMFVITGAASDPGVYYAGWDALESAARSGRWDLQAHTHDSHREHQAEGGRSLPVLTSLAPGESLSEYRARVRADLARSSESLENHTGHRPTAFAYPFGAYGGDDRTNHPAIREILEDEVDRQYAVAFHQDDQDTVPLIDGDEPAFGLRRLEVGDWSGPTLIKRIARAAAESEDASGEGGQDGAPVDHSQVAPSAAPTTGDPGDPGGSVPAPAPTTPRGLRTPGVRLPAPESVTGPVPTIRVAPPPLPAPTAPAPTAPAPTAPAPAPTVPKVTTPPPTTAAPDQSDNCGGQPHGKACKGDKGGRG